MTHSPQSSNAETPATLQAALSELVELIEASQQAAHAALMFSIMVERQVDAALFPGIKEAVGAYSSFVIDPDSLELIGFTICQSAINAREASDRADGVLNKAFGLMKLVCGEASP